MVKGHITDVSDQAHIAGPKNCYGFTALTSDFDNDGWPDIFVTCDSTANLYYHNVGGKIFEEIGVPADVASNEDGREQAGMGTATADFDGDCLLDIFKTNFADNTHTMYKNLGKNNFEDDTIDSGLAVNTKFLRWGTAFIDFDSDRWKDLIVSPTGTSILKSTRDKPRRNTSSPDFFTGIAATASSLICLRKQGRASRLCTLRAARPLEIWITTA